MEQGGFLHAAGPSGCRFTVALTTKTRVKILSGRVGIDEACCRSAPPDTAADRRIDCGQGPQVPEQPL
jgi:hypothetical protein